MFFWQSHVCVCSIHNLSRVIPHASIIYLVKTVWQSMLLFGVDSFFYIQRGVNSKAAQLPCQSPSLNVDALKYPE